MTNIPSNRKDLHHEDAIRKLRRWAETSPEWFEEHTLTEVSSAVGAGSTVVKRELHKLGIKLRRHKWLETQ